MNWNLSQQTYRRSSSTLFAISEQWRIKRYLANAEFKLVRDVHESLSETQQRNRENVISILRAYRKRGEFPKNDFVPEYSSVFIDRSEIRCAVAHLVESTGGAQLVERVGATNNLMSLAKTQTNVFNSWLDDNGITYDEAAFIQVPYNSQLDTSQHLAASGHSAGANVMMMIFIVSTLVLLFGTGLTLIFVRKIHKNKKKASRSGVDLARQGIQTSA